jgi:DNA-directed RNA polymerase subunit N (RpoN/RPB10)
MLFRVRCHTCGSVLADKYSLYSKKVKEASSPEKPESGEVPYFDKTKPEKTVHGLVLDELGITRMCCRSAMLTHIG